jgi:hypothetical protein
MIIIGVDYQPSDQYIAFADTETEEYGERRLNHGDREAEKFYRDLQQRAVSVRVGMEATGYSRWFERLPVERLGVWAVGRVRFARGTARDRTWRALGRRPLDCASRSLAAERV